MEARLLEYLRQPLVYLGIIVFVSVMIACCAKEMKGIPWRRRVLGGLAISGMLSLTWFLKSLW